MYWLHKANAFVMDTAVNRQLDSFSKVNNYSFDQGDAGKIDRFEIHTLEWMNTQRLSSSETPERLNRFEIIWVKKGNGVLQVDGQEFDFSGSVIFCVAPGHMRQWNDEVSIEGYYISFTPEFLYLSEGYSNNSAWLEKCNEQLVMATNSIGEEMASELDIIARKMKWEYKNYFNQKLEVLKGLLNIFMIYFSRNLTEPQGEVLQGREAELVRKFINLLKRNFAKQKLVIEYAGQLCVTPNYLNRVVKKVTGLTASHHIQQQIIMEAKRQAMYSQVSMKEIAYGLGFDNLAHFSKYFKTNSGINFTDFKRQVKDQLITFKKIPAEADHVEI